MNFEEYAGAFREVEKDFEASVAAFGLEFEEEESSPRRLRNETTCRIGCHLENNESSLWTSWISPACLACRTGSKTSTFFVDLRCTKDCYFCFNPNQDYYEYFLHNKRDIVAELEEAHEAGADFDCLAITGGEPLIHADDVLAFLKRARELYPEAHIRLYTSGDLLDVVLLHDLADAGLSEIRFSIKPSDVEADSRDLYQLIGDAVSFIPAVMLEVPVIPGTLDEMKDMIQRIDECGVKGINLLEMCFPLCNAEAFKKRSLKLRKHPFNVLYNYWYGGGIPVAESERDALELIEFAHEQGLSLGVHYCSSDNKNTGQIYQQNIAFLQIPQIQDAHPWLSLDREDWFIKCAKVFGDDVVPVKAFLECEGINTFEFDGSIPQLSFPLLLAKRVADEFPQACIGESIQVLESDDGETVHLKEIWVHQLKINE